MDNIPESSYSEPSVLFTGVVRALLQLFQHVSQYIHRLVYSVALVFLLLLVLLKQDTIRDASDITNDDRISAPSP